jgi:hypothetical protein
MRREIHSYRHRTEEDEQQPDDQPGDYFVSAVDGGSRALVSGPYINDHASALDDVAECRQLVEEVDPKAVFYAFGTCRLPLESGRVRFLQRHKMKELFSE